MFLPGGTDAVAAAAAAAEAVAVAVADAVNPATCICLSCDQSILCIRRRDMGMVAGQRVELDGVDGGIRRQLEFVRPTAE